MLEDLFNTGIKAEIIAVKSRKLGKKYLGQRLTHSLIQEITPYGIDPLGGQGEYHTIVLDCPLFSRPLFIKHNKPVLRGGY